MGTPAGCEYSKMCYGYVPEADTWAETGSMSGKKHGQGADYTESLGLAMAYFDDPLEVNLNVFCFSSENPAESSCAICTDKFPRQLVQGESKRTANWRY